MLYKDLLRNTKECPFCERKDLIFKENTHAYLTFALAPYHKDHLLVIPKRHVKSFVDLEADEHVSITDLLKLGSKILEKLSYNNSTVLVRSGDNNGRTVEHLHFHIVPHDPIGDLDHVGQERVVLEDDEKLEIKKRIEEAIKQI